MIFYSILRDFYGLLSLFTQFTFGGRHQAVIFRFLVALPFLPARKLLTKIQQLKIFHPNHFVQQVHSLNICRKFGSLPNKRYCGCRAAGIGEGTFRRVLGQKGIPLYRSGYAGRDTWVMNFDRRKPGHVLATGDNNNPGIWFIDFDQAFLVEQRDNKERRLHWIDHACRKQYLNHQEVLSGFSGNGPINCEKLQRAEHFEEPLKLMRNVDETDLEKILSAVPEEWNISDEDQKRWVDYLLYRRKIAFENVHRQYTNT